MEEKTSWLQKHSGELAILLAIVTACCTSLLWMNGKFEQVASDMHSLERDIRNIEKDMAVVKAVLIMKNIMPCELAKAEQ